MLFPYKDDNPRVLVPYVTYGIIAINVLVFIFQFNLGMSNPMGEENFIYRFGFVPANFSFIAFFTSMFLKQIVRPISIGIVQGYPQPLQ